MDEGNDIGVAHLLPNVFHATFGVSSTPIHMPINPTSGMNVENEVALGSNPKSRCVNISWTRAIRSKPLLSVLTRFAWTAMVARRAPPLPEVGAGVSTGMQIETVNTPTKRARGL